MPDMEVCRCRARCAAWAMRTLSRAQSVSFSLEYGANRTLDVVCKDREQYELWTTGLTALLTEGAARDLELLAFAQEVENRPNPEEFQVMTSGLASPAPCDGCVVRSLRR